MREGNRERSAPREGRGRDEDEGIPQEDPGGESSGPGWVWGGDRPGDLDVPSVCGESGSAGVREFSPFWVLDAEGNPRPLKKGEKPSDCGHRVAHTVLGKSTE